MLPRNHRAGRSLIGPVALAVLAVIVLAGTGVFARADRSATRQVVANAVAPADLVASAATATPAPKAATATIAAATRVTTTSAPAKTTSKPVSVAKPKSSAVKPSAATGRKVGVASIANPTDTYRGLGSWVDIYDERAWSNPAAAVRDMSAHGVRTLYLETANSRTDFSIKDRAKVSQFIDTAHHYNMKVVAWYLPDLKSVALDYTRVAEAIKFHTRAGQSFDGFALDIESPANGSVASRNATLLSLSTQIRKLSGPKYPLGAITPSPKALANDSSYWHAFPYAKLKKVYNVFVPMSYYTWHGKGASAAYADTVANVRELRRQLGPGVAIHMIGGIVQESSAAEVAAFAKANKDMKTLGASLYTWDGMRWAHWQGIAGIK